MASPFTRYQSEQVPQINILPYTAGIAENLRKGIADFGAGVGKGIESLGLQRQAKEQAASLAQGVINKYMEQDGPEDDATGEVTYKISDTAPAHIKDIAKKVEKEPDGVFGLATTDLNTFLTLEQKHREEKAVEFDQNYKTQILDLQRKERELAVQKLSFEKDVHSQNLELKKRELTLAEDAGKRAQIEADIKAIGLKKLEAETILNDSFGEISPVTTETQYGVRETRRGILRTPTSYEEVDDIDAFLKESGLKVATKQAQDATQNDYASALAQSLSGDPEFNPNLSAVDNPSTKKREFVRAVYEQLLKQYPSQSKVIEHKFKWNEEAKGLNKDVEVNQKTYDTALQFFKTNDFQSKVGKALGIKVKPTAPTVLPNEVEIISEEKVGMGITREVSRSKNSKERADEAYDLAKAKFDEMGAPFPLNRDDAYKIFNIYGGWTEITLPDGSKAITNGKEMIPLNRGGSIAPTATKKTEAEMKAQAANNFLRNYQQPTKTTEGKTVAGRRVGNYIISVNATSTEDPLSEMALINPEKAQADITESEQALYRSDTYIDKMKAMWGDAKFYQAFTSIGGSDWKQQYTTLQRGLETFRKAFIAPGTETERDADRLADLMAEPTFMNLLFRDPKVMQDTLELTRGILHFSAKTKLEGYNFSIQRADGKPMFDNQEQITSAVEELVKKYGAKYEPKK